MLTKKKWIIASCLISLLIASLVILSKFRSNATSRENVQLERSLSQAIIEKGTSGAVTIIDFKDVTKFEWDKVYIFQPYTSPTTINKELGYEWEMAQHTGIEMFDSFTLIVFTKQGKVVSYLRLPYSSAYFDSEVRNYYTRDEATFKIEIKDGLRILTK